MDIVKKGSWKNIQLFNKYQILLSISKLLLLLLLPLCCFPFVLLHSKAGICEMFEGHQGPVTGISCHSAVGPVDFSHLFVTSSFDWTVKLWSTKVRSSILYTFQASSEYLHHTTSCSKWIYAWLMIGFNETCGLIDWN